MIGNFPKILMLSIAQSYISFIDKLLCLMFQKPPPSDDSQLNPQNGQGAAEGFNLNPPVENKDKKQEPIQPVVPRGRIPRTRVIMPGVKDAPADGDQPKHGKVNGERVDINFNFKKECNMTHVSKDVESAMMRATSQECQFEIATTACLDHQKKLYPQKLPRFCPLQGRILIFSYTFYIKMSLVC